MCDAGTSLGHKILCSKIQVNYSCIVKNTPLEMKNCQIVRDFGFGLVKSTPLEVKNFQIVRDFGFWVKTTLQKMKNCQILRDFGRDVLCARNWCVETSRCIPMDTILLGKLESKREKTYFL